MNNSESELITAHTATSSHRRDDGGFSFEPRENAVPQQIPSNVDPENVDGPDNEINLFLDVPQPPAVRDPPPTVSQIKICTKLPIILRYQPVHIIQCDISRELEGIFSTALIPTDCRYFPEARAVVRHLRGFVEC